MAVRHSRFHLCAQETVQKVRLEWANRFFDMGRRIYVAPSANRKSGYPNRYFIFLKEALARHFDVLDADNSPHVSQGLALLRYSFSADVFLLSFVETVAFHKLAFLQYLLAMMSFAVMKLRRRKMIFIFHNPHPHKGENWMSRSLTMQMLRQSSAVISHSSDTAEYARSLVSEVGGDVSKVRYVCHPMAQTDVPTCDMSAEGVLIWGNILPYKGVLECVSSPELRNAGLSVRIVGKCPDSALAEAIEIKIAEPSSTRFVFENRTAGFDELKRLIPSSRYVLFPYLRGSVSGSGVLMDTISMGGEPVGPDFGAFADLAGENVCRVYHSAVEMVDMLKSPRRLRRSDIMSFISRNSWDSFAALISRL